LRFHELWVFKKVNLALGASLGVALTFYFIIFLR
jgi:hypothetical protein